MLKNTIIKKNIKFMIFNDINTIYNFVSEQIMLYIAKNGGINFSIESRMEFWPIFERLKDLHSKKNITFEHSNFFMCDEFIYSSRSWKAFENYTSSKMLDDIFFNHVDFKKENVHKLIHNLNYNHVFLNKFSMYDSKIDAKSGIDVLVIKVHNDGSLIFNYVIDSNNLSTKSVKFNETLTFELSDEFEQKDIIPEHGATLGIDQILKAKKIFLIGIGEDKNEMISKLFFSKRYDKFIPLCLLRNHPDIHVLCDYNATKNITRYIDIRFNESFEMPENIDVINFDGPKFSIGDDLSQFKSDFDELEEYYSNHDQYDNNYELINQNQEYQNNLFQDDYGNYYILDENGNYIPYNFEEK